MSAFTSNWQRIAVIGLVLAVAGTNYMLGRHEMNKSWEARWAARNAADATARQQREAANRTEERRQRAEMEQVTEHAEKQLATLRGDVASARAAAERLRRTVSELQQRNAGAVSGAGTTSAAGPAACGVLADVLAESVERNQQLAAEADRRRIAGLACERAYDSMLNQ